MGGLERAEQSRRGEQPDRSARQRQGERLDVYVRHDLPPVLQRAEPLDHASLPIAIPAVGDLRHVFPEDAAIVEESRRHQRVVAQGAGARAIRRTQSRSVTQLTAHTVVHARRAALQERIQDLALAGELQIDRAFADPCTVGDRRHAHGVEPVGEHEFLRGIEDAVATVRDAGAGHRWSSPGGRASRG